MEVENIEYLEQFIGKEWLNREFQKINTKSPLKGTGVPFVSYHPWVHYMYEIEYLMRSARIKGNDNVFLGEYYYLLDYAGMLLRSNIECIVDLIDAKARLRNPLQFYDFIWELEVRRMLTNAGALVKFIDPKSGKTYDGELMLNNHAIAFECKNKILDNDEYNANGVFARVLIEKLGDVDSIKGKIIEVEFISARLEDIKTVVTTVREKFDVFSYQSILGKYKVRALSLPFDTPTQQLITRDGITQGAIIKEVPSANLLNGSSVSEVIKSKILFKIPNQITSIKNLNDVLKKANSQLCDGGIVFLQVPYSSFENVKPMLARMLNKNYSNIFAVKLVAIDFRKSSPFGVEIRCLEEFIVTSRGMLNLSQSELDFFNRHMAFSDLIPIQKQTN